MVTPITTAPRVAKEAEIANVVLYHISTRYTDQEIRDAIRASAEKIGLKAKVWAALPRRVYWNLLKEKPIWP